MDKLAAEIEPMEFYAKKMIVTMIVKFDVIYPSDERKLLPSQMMDVIKG